MKRILLRNGTIVNSCKITKMDILILSETIEQIGENLPIENGVEILDCSGKLIFPGIIDSHTHMGVPIKSGFSADNFETGTKSAVHGGVTTILDFTILDENQTLRQSIESRKFDAAKSICDYNLHCNITQYSEEILSEIPILIETGITSFKIFTTYEEAGMMLYYEQIQRIAQAISAHDGLLMVHAEDDEILRNAMLPFKTKFITDPFYHALSRPDDAEAVAIQKIGEISEKTGCRIYIVHLSSAKGLETAKQFENLVVETCPQYLFLDENIYKKDDGRMFVASPPLRKRHDNDELWGGILDGSISTIGTDHCPFFEKPREIHFSDIPNGIGGVETLFPILLAQWILRKLDLRLLSKLLCKNPANVFGLSHRKGTIQIGKDADFAIVNPKEIHMNWENSLVSAVNWNAFTNFPACFPNHVFRRGDWIVKDSRLQTGSKGVFVKSKFP
ncbi:MAG: amidohydrolase family protein [Candidatus Marinimicrobia bacterium]|nr:amidohydrolase family protein [Candidatus Neomarinimicrobiota bacterium]MBL7108953.1 amidohydrolase family protein [Candidatus Neomarinimicrobiota bacterium]